MNNIMNTKKKFKKIKNKTKKSFLHPRTFKTAQNISVIF